MYPILPHAWTDVLFAWAVFLGLFASTVCADERVSAGERSMVRRFDRVVTLVEHRYYARDFHGLDWRALCASYRPSARAAPDDRAWYSTVNAMLAELGDAHTRLELPARIPGSRGAAARVIGPSAVAERESVHLDGGVLLLRFDRFDASVVRWMRTQLDAHREATGVVIDLRQNRGGLVRSTQQAVGLFFDESVAMGVVVARNRRRWIERSRPGRMYVNVPIAVLIGPGSFSSAEVFAYALQHHGRAVLVGRRTAGEVLGARRHHLRDGGGLFVSETDFLRLEGGRLEGAGVVPDIEVGACEGIKPGATGEALGAALEVLRSQPAEFTTR